MINLFTYPHAKSVVICGDIHGDFTQLVYEMCIRYDMHDTLVIVAGDCGFGFEKPAYYEQIFRRIQTRLTGNNCWIAMMRGNHDDPSYFQEQKISHQRFRTMPDYTVVHTCGHHILCVGGAISIDRRIRLEEMMHHPGKQYYWPNEAPSYDEPQMDEISKTGIRVDTVVTHTAPSFCELQSKQGLISWAAYDTELLADCENERKQMDMLLARLRQNNHPLTRWYYGHFHHSWHSEIDGIFYKMLDIMEFHTIPPIP